MLAATGSLDDVVYDLHRAVLHACADDPWGIVCDLTDVSEEASAEALVVLASLGRQARDWPAVPLAMLCPGPGMRRRLRRRSMSEHLSICATLAECVSELNRHAPPMSARFRLRPVPLASRAARDFVSRTCLDWGLRHGVASACLVVSEFVTNVVLHAVTDMEVSIAYDGRRLRVAVRDRSSDRPQDQLPDPGKTHGRGLIIVEEFSRAWGTLPASDGGKVAWAVFDV